ncbi:LamG domain-containing protein [uncultured Lacinutrix sp.]|uniref:beta strand repeat-containing protein n=1 Tax=uncultured Lacinutrix sp. TaxID=574032 RepID=UPI002616B44C|nr:LamG domain-containing protein [uncultured Lacinutrix sp.]
MKTKLLLTLALLINFAIQAQTTFTAIDGPGEDLWSEVESWQGGVIPGSIIGPGDSVVIPVGVLTTIDISITNNGTLTNQGTLTNNETLTNNGNLNLTQDSRLRLVDNSTFTNTSIVLASNTSVIVIEDANSSLTNAATGTLTLDNSSEILAFGGQLINNGTLILNDTSAFNQFEGFSGFITTNNNLLTITSSAVFRAGILNNNGNLTNNGVLEIDNNSTNAGTLTNTGTFENTQTLTNTSSASLINTSAGSFYLKFGATLSNTGLLDNSGSLIIEDNPSNGSVINNSGNFNNSGIFQDINGYSTLSGTNTSHTGDFSNAGTLSPGNSTGTYTFNNNYTQQSTATLTTELETTSSFDVVTINGTATLAGTLDVSLVNGFTPSVGDTFTILTANSISGTFDTVNLPTGTGYDWNINYTATEVILEVAPTFTAPADVCEQTGIQNGLDGGLPIGGVYSGPGVTDDGNGMTYSFNPTTSGVGTHTITYTQSGTSAMDDIEVFAAPTVAFTAPEDLCIDTGIQTGLSGGTPAVSITTTTVTVNIGYDEVGFSGFIGGDIVFNSSGAMQSTNVTASSGVAGITINLTNATASGDTITLTFDNGQTPTIVANTTIIGASGNLNFTSGTSFTIDGDSQDFVSGTGTVSTDILGSGVYSGPGVIDDGNVVSYSFDPAAAGVGTHTITYIYTNDNGCVSSASDTIEIFALPTITFTAPEDVCLSAGVQIGLGNATPSGGIYSGPGVTDDGNGMTYSFDPAIAGAGVHTITYDVTIGNGCSNSASDTIEVIALDDASFSYSASVYGCDVTYPTPTITGLTGGLFSSGTGLAIDPNTGEIDTAATLAGTYTVTYTTTGNCVNSSSVSITFTTSCMPATAFNFDGIDDYAVAVNPSILDITTGTIEMRIKPLTKTTKQTILGYRSSTGGSTKYLFNLLENLSGIGFWNGSSFLTIPFAFNEDQWYNITVTDDDSGSSNLYIDGQFVGAFASEFGTATGADLNLYVGVAFPGSEYFKGDIGDIRIWNTVKANGTASCTPGASGADLIAYYNFNQGFENSDNSSVDNILDATSNANNLQLTNVALTSATSNWVNTDNTIFDTVFPTVITQDITINLTCSASTTITAANIDNGSFDNCGIASLAIDIDTFDISMLGANTVTLTVTDFYGNESSQTAQVTVVDNIQTRLYVNQFATSNFDGTSWETGFFNLQDAIIASLSCSTITEIWVASGTYSPSALPRNNTITAGISTRDNTFHLPNGIKIYGGFNATDTSIDQRDIAANPTILSGNIGNPSSSTDNTYHVVTSVLDNAETRLDGFIIEGGLTTFNDVTGLTIEGIDVRRRLGAGISNHNSSTVFANLIIRDNTADIGAGIYNKETINTSYTNIVIHNNNTVGFGIGGGMYNKAASFTATNVLIANNFSDAGPAIYNDSSSSATLTNLTVFNNTSPSTFLNGSALIANSNSTITITNTVMYNNTRDIGLVNNSTVSGTNNYVLTDPAQFGSPAGFTQLIADPFINSADIDGLDDIFGTPDDGLMPLETGVLVDAGNTSLNATTTDITGHIRNLGANIDVGTYEYQSKLMVAPKVFLQGALLGNTNGLMRDDLRTNNYLPTTSPYADGLTCDASVFNTGGTSATGLLEDDIVDWIWVELRDETDNTAVIVSTSALLQRDGDVVAVDGVSNPDFLIPYKNHYVTLKHRNHLGVMTANTIALNGTAVPINFTDATMPITFGTNAQTTFGIPTNTLAMWAGDSNGDGRINYSGAISDVPFIRSQVFNDPNNSVFGGPPVASYSSEGYFGTDVNMDSNSVYSGTTSDVLEVRNNIFNNPSNSVFGGPPTSTYLFTQQLPEGAND